MMICEKWRKYAMYGYCLMKNDQWSHIEEIIDSNVLKYEEKAYDREEMILLKYIEDIEETILTKKVTIVLY